MNTMQEPNILTQNTFYWQPHGNAQQRRNNEARRLSEVKNFFKSLGMEIEKTDKHIIGRLKNIEADFYYSESCKNVYKKLTVYKDGNRSNITSLRKLYK